MLIPVCTVAPAADLISLAEAKAHCRIDSAEDDALVTGLIASATAHLDGWSGILGRALVNQTWRQDYPCFHGCRLPLPLAPAVSITSVKYYDADNVQQTLATSVYEGPFVGPPGPYVALKSGQSWPATYEREAAVSVTYVAGYGATAASVPSAIRQAMLLMIGHWYENREAASAVSFANVPYAVDALLAPFRRVGC